MKASECKKEDLDLLKKQLKLPVTKELKYYKQKSYMDFEVFDVIDFEVIKELSSSKVLKIELSNHETITILGDYLSEMQKPDFVSILKAGDS